MRGRYPPAKIKPTSKSEAIRQLQRAYVSTNQVSLRQFSADAKITYSIAHRLLVDGNAGVAVEHVEEMAKALGFKIALIKDEP